MATPSRVQTRSRNATTRPALPVLQLNEEVDSDLKAVRAFKKQKAADLKQQKERAMAKELATLESGIAAEDAIDDTPRPSRLPQPKASKSTASKLRHVHTDPVSASETSDEPCPVMEEETDTPAVEDDQYSDNEWGDDKTSDSDGKTSINDDEGSQNKQSQSKKARAAKGKPAKTTKKKSARARKTPMKPIPPKKSIQDALDQESELTEINEDDVDATPVPKRRQNGVKKTLTKVVEDARRGRSALNVSISVQIDESLS